MQASDDNSGPFSEPSLSSEDVQTYIARLLNDEEWELRAASAKALGQSGSAQAVEPLCIALTDQNWHVRIAAVGALGHLKDMRAVEPLCGALADTDWYIRIAATVALGQLGDIRAVGSLCAALEDTDAPVRSSAAAALGQIGDVWAVEALCAASKDKEADVRRSAATALDSLGTADTLPLKVLSSTTMTPAQLLGSLQSLVEMPGRISRTAVTPRNMKPKTFHYTIRNVQAYCETLCRGRDTEECVRLGAAAVLAELQNRAAAAVLLRASQSTAPQEKAELLRGASGLPDPTPSEELLRAATSSETPNAEKPRLLSRIFRREG